MMKWGEEEQGGGVEVHLAQLNAVEPIAFATVIAYSHNYADVWGCVRRCYSV